MLSQSSGSESEHKGAKASKVTKKITKLLASIKKQCNLALEERDDNSVRDLFKSIMKLTYNAADS